MPSYGSEVTIVVEASDEMQATDIINNLKSQPGITDVDIQEGPEEIVEPEEDDED